MRNGHVFRQVLWEPATSVTVGGLLPTPVTPSGGRSVPSDAVRSGLSAYKDGKKYQVDLQNHMRHQMLPTPRANSAMTVDLRTQQNRSELQPNLETAMARMLPTPVAQTSKGGPKGLDGGSAARQMLAAAGFPRAAGAPTPLPTPTVNDSKNSTLPPSQINRDGLAGAMLRNDSTPTGTATYLNPSFVEEMMGFPVGWTA
jgi:hypothetical protein